jgi:hypothetical protein
MEEVPHVGGAHYIGVSMKDKVRRFLSAEDKDGNTVEEQYSEPIPEDLMTQLEQYGGDGRARVSVGGELTSSTNFGFKAAASTHMSVTCDNNLEVMEEVHDLVQPYVEKLVLRDHARMADLRANMVEALIGERAARLTEPASPPEPESPGKVASPPAKTKVAPSKTTGGRKAVKAGTKARSTRPSFKRK